ncbi:general transcription and DNA repair factor IIH subunit Tfb1p [Trichomonascus vanleenenianus]|uniref:TFIIH/NER complex subunit TFB1 n=1 Tax=Trichomonascus vanleenenianus TaxID=2268995 RepID=UPI003ECA9A8E
MFTTPATYKKNTGTLKTADNDKLVQWQAANESAPAVSFAVAKIQSMTATPATSAKILLKIIVLGNTGEEPTSYMFSFTSRDLLESAKVTFQALVQKERSSKEEAANGSVATANGAPNGQAKQPVTYTLDAKKLLANHELQKGLLKENKELMKTFQEAVIQGGLSASEFWGSRVALLRAYSFTLSQKRGKYNVLSTIKPATGTDNEVNVSLTREKIHDIFEQYPIVRQAYNENVPRLSEQDFWGRFFQSRLFRKLRCEKIGPNDKADAVLDKYLTQEDTLGTKKRKAEEQDMYVPQYLDIEGNEENSSEKLGNRPDMTMRPGFSGLDTMSQIRTMNLLSQHMLQMDQRRATAAKEDENAADSTPVAADTQPQREDEELDELMGLSDLKDNETTAKSVELHIKEQKRLTEESDRDSEFKKTLDTAAFLQEMRQNAHGVIDLSVVGEASYKPAIVAANDQIVQTRRLRSKEATQNLNNNENWGGERRLLDQIQMTHATSIEFLRHFWSHFLSGDPGQAAPLAKIVASLKKSLERIDAVVQQGQSEQDKKKIRHSLQPLSTSILTALDKYNEALANSTTTVNSTPRS